MFAAKSTIFLALLALCNVVVAATPPACLLAAVNTQDKPSDMNALCGAKSADVQEQINGICGENSQAALKAYSSSCADAGQTVSIIKDPIQTQTGMITATNTVGGPTGTGGASPTSTGGSPSESTGAAASNKVGSAFAAVAVFAGVAAAL